jgi:hypothetical protein
MTFPFSFTPTGSTSDPDYNAGQFGFNPGPNLTPQTPTIQIEDLSLPDVMKNPHVQRMFNIQQSLYQENTRLSAEVKELQTLRHENV